jgi:hypothetical protein
MRINARYDGLPLRPTRFFAATRPLLQFCDFSRAMCQECAMTSHFLADGEPTQVQSATDIAANQWSTQSAAAWSILERPLVEPGQHRGALNTHGH